MIQELDQIVLTTDLSDYGLHVGDIGTVVIIHTGGAGYKVEFVALDGETVAVVSLYPNQVRPIAHCEIAHARTIKYLQQRAARGNRASFEQVLNNVPVTEPQEADKL